MDWLLAPLGYDFFRNAIATGALIGLLCPIVGSYLIVLRMSLLADAIAHAMMPGLAIAYALGIDLTIGAFISGLSGSLVIAWIRHQSRVRVDAAMALTFASFFGLGIALISLFHSRIDLEAFLFGDILNVTIDDWLHALLATGTILALVKLNYKELLLYTFDPIGAKAQGLPVTWLYYGLMVGVTLAIVISLKIVGVILAIALLIGPAITAYLVVKELHWMMVVGSVWGMVAVILGMYLSFYLNLPSGSAIALTIFAGFILTLLLSPHLSPRLTRFSPTQWFKRPRPKP